MKINLPINKFKFEDNKVYINESVVEYDEVSEDTKEILESLITKGAYGSALLTLNLFYNVKKINESDYTYEEYLSYVNECNKLMKECVVETRARNFKPLVNLNGLEIMESEDHIARGKGDVLLVEDFRSNALFEKETSKEYSDYCNDLGIDPKKKSSKDKFIKDYTKWASSLYGAEDLESKVDKVKKDLKAISEECEGTQCSDIAEKKDQEVGQLQTVKKKKKEVVEESKDFTPSEIDKYVASYNSATSSHKTAEDFEWLYMAGQVDGFKIKGVSGTQIFDISSGEYLGPYDKWIKESFDIPRNHKFKGFMMKESGRYERGNYVLIKENGEIKAVNKKVLENIY